MAVHLLLLNPFVAVKPCTLNIWNTYSIFDICVIQLQARKEKKKVKLNRLSKQNKSVKSMHILLYPQRRGHEASRPQIPALWRESIRLYPWPPAWRRVHGAPISWCSATRRSVNSRPPQKEEGYQLQVSYSWLLLTTRRNSLPIVVLGFICVSQTQISPHKKYHTGQLGC